MYRAGHYAGADGRDGRPAWAELLTHRVWQRQQHEDPHAAGCIARPGWLRADRHCQRTAAPLTCSSGSVIRPYLRLVAPIGTKGSLLGRMHSVRFLMCSINLVSETLVIRYES